MRTTGARMRRSQFMDERIRGVKKADWRGNRFKERELRNAIWSLLESQAKETGGYDIDAVMKASKGAA